MLFGPSLDQLALLCFLETSDLSSGPRPDRGRVHEKPHMPELTTYWSPPAWT